jgi:hypothetical protein
MRMLFDSANELDSTWRSQARQARDEFLSFPPFRGEATHEALAASVLF